MFSSNRRRFLGQAAAAGIACSTWNVWYRARGGEAANGHQHEAPHLLEEVYNLEDALLVGGLINSQRRPGEAGLPGSTDQRNRAHHD